MLIPARCEECGTTFDPLRGGICPVCHRLLCPRHLRGWQGMLGLPNLGNQQVCTRCWREDRTVETNPAPRAR